jgi:flavin reductase (DIM6/NTAB) family NADH-FMN oxidoreductase RutF
VSAEHFYRPEDGHGLPHDPFKAIVAPRPVGWISTQGTDGTVNLAPYSFFNAVAGRPPIVMFSSETEKDTVALARQTGEFVCNFVSADLAEQMNRTSKSVPRGTSEFDLAGIAMAPCHIVAAPRVASAPAALECVVTQIMQQRDRHGRAIDVWTVFGEVVGVHIAAAFLENGRFDTVKADPVMRMGYRDFGRLGPVFTLRRPDD